MESGVLIGDSRSISGNLFNSATVIFDQATEAAYGGQISGRGLAVKRGGGALRLDGGSRHLWRIEEGALISSAERYFGNTQIDAPGALRFEQAADAAYAGKLSGGGTFTKTGAGRLNLTGDSSAFAGQTLIQEGALFMGDQGQLGGRLTIASGATLAGTGRVGATLLQGGARIAPGDGVGTLKVAGDLTFSPGSLYLVEVDPNSTASDRIVVTGVANLAGSVLHVGAEGRIESARRYTILTAGSVLGRFESVSSNFEFLDLALLYGAQDVTLVLARKGVAFAGAAETENQRATADALDGLPRENPLHEYILTLPSGAAPGVFDSLSGELHASIAAGLIGSGAGLRARSLSHLRRGLADRPAPGEGSPVWVDVWGAWRTLEGDGNAAEFEQSAKGLFVGADRAFGQGWRLGAGLGYAAADITVDDRSSSADISSYSVTLFGGKAFKAGGGVLNLLMGAGYSWHEIDTRRGARLFEAPQDLTSDYSAGTAQGFAELGYLMPLSSHVSLEPFAALEWTDVRIDGFAEAGGAAALAGRSSHDEQAASVAGLRTRASVMLGRADARLRASLGWRHAYGEVVARKTLAFEGSQAFTVAGAPIARYAAVVEAGVDVALTRTITAGFSYSGQFGDGDHDHAGVLTLRWKY